VTLAKSYCSFELPAIQCPFFNTIRIHIQDAFRSTEQKIIMGTFKYPSDGSSHVPSSSPLENSVTSIQVIDLILVDPVTNEDILGAFDCLPYICIGSRES
jgi:hypothetical protein